MAQLVSLVERRESVMDIQDAELLKVVIVSDPQPEDGVSRWEDDGGAVVPALALAA